MTTFISAFAADFNLVLAALFAVLYSYRVLYFLVAFQAKRHKYPQSQHIRRCRYAVIIPARNEERVIGLLIQSINVQNYPRELIDVFVVADNCTDNTAQVAKQAGAIVRERFNKAQVGKGYALDFMFKFIEQNYASNAYEGYFVFDADNLLDEDYIFEMNKTLNQGYRIVTSYRNSKNYDQNWITAGYGLWFMHEAEYINLPRMFLNTSCAISGTGFLVHADVLRENGGWVHHLLTEDIEFSVSQIIKGEKIGYCRKAMFYDEQPITFAQSWNQRLRWVKGFYQVFNQYGKGLFRGMIYGKNSFSCFDITMTIMPAVLISWVSLIWNGGLSVALLLGGKQMLGVHPAREFISVLGSYGLFFGVGFMTTITEWNKILCTNQKKIFYMFTFPLFMFTYLPISIVALFKKIEWKPIAHTVVKSIDDIR